MKQEEVTDSGTKEARREEKNLADNMSQHERSRSRRRRG